MPALVLVLGSSPVVVGHCVHACVCGGGGHIAVRAGAGVITVIADNASGGCHIAVCTRAGTGVIMVVVVRACVRV